MDSQDIAKIIFDFHLKRLKNLNVKNNKIMILFSGITGSGKSYLAKKIEERYKGLRINNDDIRDIIRDEVLPLARPKSIDKQNILENYLGYLYGNLPQTNGFLIMDSSIDRKFSVIKDFASKNSYAMFIIRIDLPREMITKQILQRTEKDSAPYISDLNRQIEDHDRAATEFVPDFTIKEEKFNDFDKLFRAIDKKIS